MDCPTHAIHEIKCPTNIYDFTVTYFTVQEASHTGAGGHAQTVFLLFVPPQTLATSEPGRRVGAEPLSAPEPIRPACTVALTPTRPVCPHTVGWNGRHNMGGLVYIAKCVYRKLINDFCLVYIKLLTILIFL